MPGPGAGTTAQPVGEPVKYSAEPGWGPCLRGIQASVVVVACNAEKSANFFRSPLDNGRKLCRDCIVDIGARQAKFTKPEPFTRFRANSGRAILTGHDGIC